MASDLEKYNQDELEAPVWLNVEFFNKVLRKHIQDNAVEVKHLEISPATCKGDHYASVMFRVAIVYIHGGQKNNKSLIVKIMPEYEGNKKDLLKESFAFETEIGMYTEVLPKFHEILRSVRDETIFMPPCIYHSLSPHKLIILEDICPLGYTVIRDRATTMDEVRATYEKISKIHAISYKVLSENPTYFVKYRHSSMSMSNMFELEFMKSGLKLFLETLDEVPTLQQYKRYFEPIQNDFLQRVKRNFGEYHNNPKSDAYYVLCHGDFHAKNLMVKYNAANNALEDILLLDFQFSYVGSIVNDIIYSFYMLMDEELREHNRDELIYFYFNNFVLTLEKIGFEGSLPSLRKFRQEILRHRNTELFLLYTFFPVWFALRDGKHDADELVYSTDALRKLYKNKLYINELHKLLPKYLYWGYLENLNSE